MTALVRLVLTNATSSIAFSLLVLLLDELCNTSSHGCTPCSWCLLNLVTSHRLQTGLLFFFLTEIQAPYFSVNAFISHTSVVVSEPVAAVLGVFQDTQRLIM